MENNNWIPVRGNHGEWHWIYVLPDGTNAVVTDRNYGPTFYQIGMILKNGNLISFTNKTGDPLTYEQLEAAKGAALLLTSKKYESCKAS